VSRILDKASVAAVAVTLVATLFSADSGAIARGSYAKDPTAATEQEATRMISQPVVQPLPASAKVQDEAAADQVAATNFAVPSATTLAGLVDAQPQSGDLSRELNCLAGAIYFESKSEPLEGQLAVGRVIVARSKSGRFPASYCGVVYQPSQFSFVHGNAMPGINKGSEDWREAVAVAQIADAGTWQSPVEGAISFHAASVSPGWRLKRLARVGNHIFYR
jgi:N-acetylmuramoyl-L-alanine amidase